MSESLGQLIFEIRRSPPRIAGILYASGMVGLAATVFFLVGQPVLSLVFLLLVVILVVSVCARRGGADYYVYEQGIRESGRSGARTIIYYQLERMTWRAIRQNALFAGQTHEQITLYPKGQTRMRFLDSQPWTLGFTGSDKLSQIDVIRELAGNAMADCIEARLAAGDEVPWIRRLVFVREGLRLKDQSIVTWDKLTHCEIHLGQLTVCVAGRRRPIVSAPIDVPNLYPGYLLCRRCIGLYASRRGQ